MGRYSFVLIKILIKMFYESAVDGSVAEASAAGSDLISTSSAIGIFTMASLMAAERVCHSLTMVEVVLHRLAVKNILSFYTFDFV